MIPQLIMIALTLISLGMDIQRNGEPKTGNHNASISFAAMVIYFAILYWGGFFDCFFK